jgi:hypothetical protein
VACADVAKQKMAHCLKFSKFYDFVKRSPKFSVFERLAFRRQPFAPRFGTLT